MSRQAPRQSTRRLLDPVTRRFIGHFLGAYPTHTVWMVTALLFSALAEGIGLLTLLPILELAIDGNADAASLSAVSRLIIDALSMLSIAPTLPILLTLVVLSFTLKGLLHYLAMRQVGFTVANVGHDLRLELLDALMHARWSHVEQQSIGQVSNSISSETHRASWGYLSICSAIAELLQILVYLVIILSISWQVAAVLPVAALVVFVAFGRMIGLSRRAGNRSTSHLSDLVRRLAELLTGLKAIKAMGLERESWPLMIREAAEFRDAQQQLVIAREALKAAYEPVVAVMLAVVVWAVLSYSSLGFATLLLIAALFQRLMTRASLLQGHYQSVTANESAFFAVHEQIQGARQAVEPMRGDRPATPLTRQIELDGLRFSHGEKPVLTGIDVTLEAGGLYVITGVSGAGKSTLVDLLLDLYQPDDGEIRIDGQALADVDAVSWRHQLGYLPQEPLLFHASLRRNITLDNPGIDQTAIERACELAGVLDAVRALPDGFNHVVGERGTRLSGGQRQRICLARALVRSPSLVLLDEATSALDPATEQRVCRNLESLRGQTTVIAISHQSAIREVADRVFRLEGGRLHEEIPE